MLALGTCKHLDAFATDVGSVRCVRLRVYVVLILLEALGLGYFFDQFSAWTSCPWKILKQVSPVPHSSIRRHARRTMKLQCPLRVQDKLLERIVIAVAINCNAA